VTKDYSKKSARKLDTHMQNKVKHCVVLGEIAALSDAAGLVLSHMLHMW
jgi:hypothetical protein